MTTNRFALSASVPVAIAVILLSILYYVFDIDGRSSWGYLTYAVLLAGIVWGVLQLRDKHFGGVITYGQSFAAGTLISLYTGAITAVYTFLFYKYFAPEQIQVLLEKAEDEMYRKAPQLSDQEFEMAMAMTAKFMTPFWLSVTTLVGLLIIGLILSLIASIFLKRNEPNQIIQDQNL